MKVTDVPEDFTVFYNVVIAMKAPTLIRRGKPSTSQLPVPAKESLSSRSALIVSAALAAAVFAIYSPALNFQFVLDDHRFLGDPRLQSSGHLWEYFTTYVWAQIPGGPASFYRPIFVLWLRWNYILFEMSPWGWHLLSIAKHIAVAILLGLLTWRLLRDRVAALLAGTLFALHPAQTESVAWVTVPDPLMSAAVLSTLLLYLRHASRATEQKTSQAESPRKKSGKRRQRDSRTGPLLRWIVSSAAACMIALMAKETALVLPVVLFAVAFITVSGKNRSAEESPGNGSLQSRVNFAFRQSIPFLSISVVYLMLRIHALKGDLSPRTQHLAWSTLVLSWPATLWFYVKVLLWPLRPRAFSDPLLAETFSVRGVLLPTIEVLGAVALLAGGCVWAWRASRHGLEEQRAVGVRVALLVGSLILVLPILLALNLNALNPGDSLHGRYTYLPLGGLMLLLATGFHLLKDKIRILVLCLAGFVTVGFSILTVEQEGAWKDDLTVFMVAHQYAPYNRPVARNLARAHVQVALSLDEQDRCDEAVSIFDEAIQQYPEDWYAWAGRGECLFKLNNLPLAEQSLRRASELSHEPRVAEQWQQVRAKMGLPPAPLL